MNKAEKYSEKIFDKKVEIYGEINLQLSNLTDAWVLLIKNQYRDETLSFKEFRNKPFFIKSPSDFKSKDDLEKYNTDFDKIIETFKPFKNSFYLYGFFLGLDVTEAMTNIFDYFNKTLAGQEGFSISKGRKLSI